MRHLFHVEKIDFWPQISKFWGQKSTFSPPAANWSLNDQCFQHEKGVSLESRYEGTKIFTPCPQNLDIWGQKSILCLVIAIFVDGTNDHYTRGYNFPIGTTPEKFPVSP